MNVLTNLKIGVRLLVSFLVLGVITAIVGVTGIYGIYQISGNLAYLGGNRFSDLEVLAVLNRERMTVEALTFEAMVTAQQSTRQTALSRIRDERKSSFARVDEAWRKLVATPRATERGRSFMARLQSEIGAWRSAHEKLDEIIDQLSHADASNELQRLSEEFRSIFERERPATDAMGRTLLELGEYNFSVTTKMIETDTSRARNLIILMVVILVLGMMVSITFDLIISRSLVQPLSTGVAIACAVAEGDLSTGVPEELLGRKDEIGDLSKAMQLMVTNLRKLVGDVSEGVRTLAASASELSAISAQTTQSVRELSARTSTAASAAEEASETTAAVVKNMESASTNLASVASATEQMSATIGEIASSTEKARAISSAAGEEAASVSALMQELGKAAQEIGKVTETITDISSQTNLLALNATIEAARAGTAGKGFAVVANEIKELAKQTAGATEDIKSKIAGVQSSAGSAISDIEKITSVISEVGHLVSGIATAIEEQAVVTRDVAGNIAQASSGVVEANERVGQTARVSSSMASDIGAVDAAATEIRKAGEQVQASAVELTALAEGLTHRVGQFKK